MRVLFYNLMFLVIAGLFGAIVAEVFLRFDGRYADLVNENLVSSRAIWDRPPNQTQYRIHPDLTYDVEIILNELSIRNHRGITLKDIEEFQGEVIGVFGDSMTENRRINDEFTFTSVLNQFLQPDFMVLNLGVDGYGLDQSYLKYLDFKGRSQLSHVYYMFYHNDLRNIYENQLFDFSSGELGEPRAQGLNPFIEVARQYHVVYLFVDAYARLKANFANKTYDSESLNKKIKATFGVKELSERRGERYHDEYADSMVEDLLSDSPSESTLEWASKFRILLNAWKSDATSSNQNFSILVIPNQVTTDLAKKLFGQQFPAETVYLIDHFPQSYRYLRFENDNHWNERGNLRAAQAIADWGVSAEMWPPNSEKWVTYSAEVEEAIKELYQQ